MNKYLLIGKRIATLLVLLVTATALNAQRTASVSGNWNSTTTWGGSSVPTASDAVTINNGVTVTINTTASCASIAINGGNTANGITFSGTNSLTVSGAITISSGTGANDHRIIAVGAGSLSCASITMNSTGNDDRYNRLSVSTGTVTVSGNITMNDGDVDRNNVVFTGSGTLNVGGSFTGGGVTVSTSKIVYNGSGNQTVRNLSYNNLEVTTSGVKTLAGSVSGTFTIGGTATVGGSLSYGTNGILKYNGTEAQTTTNVEFPSSMSGDVVIDNAAGVTLNGTKTLSGSLTLTNGVLTTSSANELRFPNNFTTVNGGSASSYVSGPVRKTGNDAFTFPVGKDGVYAQVTITAPDNTSDAFTVEYFRASSSMGGIDAAIAANVARASSCEYWDIEETNDAGFANSISVTVTWSAGSGCGTSPYITDVTKLTLLHFNTTTNKWDSYGGTASGTANNGTILRTGVSTFSPFTLGSLSVSANPLPVSFVNEKAFEKGSGVQIEWTNATESDMSAYVIERSADGISFTTIGQTTPRSNQFDKVSYSYVDAAPLAGTNFYRVKAVELTGKNVYSRALRVDIGRSPKGISLYPNPVRGSVINIGFSALKGQYNLNVLNTAGQVVYRQSINHAGGNMSQSVSLPASLKAGVYNVLISGDNYKETKMFIIQ